MNSESNFELLDEFEPVALESVGERGISSLLVCGVVNPFGPTLNALLLDGEPEPGMDLPIVQMMLNPFSQFAVRVGTAHIGDTWHPFEQVQKFFRLPFGSCPTLLYASEMFEPNMAQAINAYFLCAFEDASRTRDSVAAYPGNPWGRVQEDVNRFQSAAIQQISGEEPDQLAEDRQLEPEEAKDFVSTLLDPNHQKLELQAFLNAWQGAIDFQIGSGSDQLAQGAMSRDDFIRYFVMIAETIDLPDPNAA